MKTPTSLVQTLAVQSQLNLPGTAGRLLKQIRDLETIAPRFVEAGLVQTVPRPASLDTRLSGISTRFTTAKLAGGIALSVSYLYVHGLKIGTVTGILNGVQTGTLPSGKPIFNRADGGRRFLELGAFYANDDIAFSIHHGGRVR